MAGKIDGKDGLTSQKMLLLHFQKGKDRTTAFERRTIDPIMKQHLSQPPWVHLPLSYFFVYRVSTLLFWRLRALMLNKI